MQEKINFHKGKASGEKEQWGQGNGLPRRRQVWWVSADTAEATDGNTAGSEHNPCASGADS